MKSRFAMFACAAALLLAGCGTTGGITFGGAGSGLAKSKAFIDADLQNAEAIYVNAGDTVRAPCPPALQKWVDSLPGNSQAITISGLASGIALADVTINGVHSGIPDYVTIGCGPLFFKDAQNFNRLLSLVATIHP